MPYIISDMYRIMIVEDDAPIAGQIAGTLQSWGYEALSVHCFENVKEEFGRYRPDLVVMDLNLPGKNGICWTREIREFSDVPILFLSGNGTSASMVSALGQGADDYVVKPFDSMLLVSKIQALLRRAYDFKGHDRLEHDGVVFDPESGNVSYDGKSCELTRNESRILKTLLKNSGRTVSRTSLMEALWQTDCYIDENTLSVNVNRLRHKLASIGVESLISTRKGEGYQIG